MHAARMVLCARRQHRALIRRLRRDNTKRRDVREANIEAAKAVADAVRTSLGPRGMDKMVRGSACDVDGGRPAFYFRH